MRDRPLLWHLGAVLAAALLPMIALVAYLLVQVAAAERARHEAEARDAAERITAAVDRQLVAFEAVLEVLATSDHLAAGDLPAFRRRALGVRRPPGAEIVLRDLAGRRLATTGAEEEGPRADPDTDRAAAESGQTQISDLLEGVSPPRFSVVAGVPAGDQVAYLLDLEVPAAALAEVLAEAGVPARMTASVLDRQGTVVSRSSGADRVVGRKVPLGAPSLEPRRRQGWVRTTDLEGQAVALAFARSGLTGWTAVVFLPESEFEAPLRRSLLAAAALGVLLAALAAFLAALAARRIARSIGALAGFAEAADDASLPAPATPVREVNQVGGALAVARDKAMRRVAEREELLGMFDQAQVMARDTAGRIGIWTRGKQQLLGWTREEVLGRDGHALFRTEFPRPLPEIEAELLARGCWQGELHLHHRDGRRMAVASRWTLRRDAAGRPVAVIEACNDITALRDAEDALRRSRDLLASVLGGSADPIFACDKGGRIVLLNAPAARLLGMPDADLRGAGPPVRMPAGAAGIEAAMGEVAASGETRSLEMDLAAEGPGDARCLLVTLSPWRDAAGAVTGVVCVARDVTLRRRAEERLRDMQAELLHVSRLTAMGAVASAMAHEVNQPLTACANFANAARRLLAGDRPPDAARLAEALGAMAEAAEQAVLAGQIVRRMRGFVTRSDGDKRPVAVNAALRDAAALALLDGREAGVTARFELDPGDPVALCDRVQVQQVVVNLVRNAVEAMRAAPRRELTVASRTIGSEFVEVSVVDTGHGLSPEVAERLFEPFVSSKRGGMGVGLWICRSILEEHGGVLSVASSPGGGTVFRFTLPAIPKAGDTDDA